MCQSLQFHNKKVSKKWFSEEHVELYQISMMEFSCENLGTKYLIGI